jgi:AcrR family transcriptional regulator
VTLPARVSTRDLAKTAVREELARVAFDLFLRHGFENVTMSDIAREAGVSRSTLLRHFGSKQEIVLRTWDVSGPRAVDALLARPPHEDAWTALHHALDASIAEYHRDPVRVLAISRLVRSTGALQAGHLAKQHSWRPALAEALAHRETPARAPELWDSIVVAAALDCLVVAIEQWIASDGGLDLSALIDDAFATIAPTSQGATSGRPRISRAG